MPFNVLLLPLGLSFTFSPDSRLFTSTSPTIVPKLVIDDIKIVSQHVLLTDSLISRLEHRIASKNLQIPLEVTVCKSFAISTGRLEETIDLSLRDNYAHFLYICFYENQDALGNFQSCYLKFANPNIANIYLSAGLDIKLPSIPGML